MNQSYLLFELIQWKVYFGISLVYLSDNFRLTFPEMGMFRKVRQGKPGIGLLWFAIFRLLTSALYPLSSTLRHQSLPSGLITATRLRLLLSDMKRHSPFVGNATAWGRLCGDGVDGLAQRFVICDPVSLISHPAYNLRLDDWGIQGLRDYFAISPFRYLAFSPFPSAARELHPISPNIGSILKMI